MTALSSSGETQRRLPDGSDLGRPSSPSGGRSPIGAASADSTLTSSGGRASRLRARVERERRREAMPGGLFGTYWKHGVEGRDEARKTASQRWDRLLARAETLS